MRVLQGNSALAEARAELARLAAENERFRIARDLHDLLGHSLTTITVKAGLAARLGAPADPARRTALQEIGEVEELSRQVLARRARSRCLRLQGGDRRRRARPRGKELLRASGVTADLPTATEVIPDPTHQELLGWAVRVG